MSSGTTRGSSSSSAGESLRNSCNDFARTLARLPASIMEGLSRSIPRRRSHHHHHPAVPHRLQPPTQAPPPLLPPPFVPEELVFFSMLEQQYGTHHPFFYGCRFADALRSARREGKLVFVYLHDPAHPYTEPFCRRTLCSDLVVEFLDANFVSWGAVAGIGEGPAMVASLQPGSFPFCAVVAPVSDESIAVLQQVEGPVSPAELVETLQRTIDEQGAAFRASYRPDEQAAAVRSARTAEEEEKRRLAQRLRQEQDAAYLESLRRDQEKEKSRKSLQEGAAKPKAGSQLRPRHPGHGQTPRQPTKTTQIRASPQKEIPASQRTEPNTKIMIRFPNGERRQQSFRHTDTLRDLYRFVDSLGIPGIGSYQLVRSYPRKTYGHQQLGMTLGDAGFYPSVALYIEQLQ